MPDVRGCEQHNPHEAHSWTSSPYLVEQNVLNFWCPGVPDDSAPKSQPVDILFTPTDEGKLITLDDDGLPLVPDRERDFFDPFTQGYSYDSTKATWWHNECGAYVIDPKLHTEWHQSLDRQLRDR